MSKLLVIPTLLLAGVALGPHTTSVMADEPFLEQASDFGLVLLLFYTSLFTRPRALQEGGRIALPLAAYDLLLNFAAAYGIGALFHWDLGSRLILAGVMTTSSTGAILKILTDEGRLLRREGSVLIALLWIEDLAFVGFYFFLSAGLPGSTPSFGLRSLLGLGLFAAYLLLLGLVREFVWKIPQKEILVPLVTGLGLLGTYVGSLSGLPLVGTAFTTGIVLAGSRGADFIQTEAPYLREAAAAIFFLAFGALLDPTVTGRILPLAAAALVGIVFTEFLFLPQLARLLGLTGIEAHVVGWSLLARGGKSAAFARLGTQSATGHAAEIQSLSGVLTVLLTPISPLLVRAVLWLRRFETGGIAAQRKDAVSQVARRVLAPGVYAQKNLAPWFDRVALMGWIGLPAALGAFAMVLPWTWRLFPVAFGILLLAPAYQATRSFFSAVPGAPSSTLALRRRGLPRLETYLPSVLLAPCALVLVLPVVAPWAILSIPIAGGLTLALVLLLPLWVHPSPRDRPRQRQPRRSLARALGFRRNFAP